MVFALTGTRIRAARRRQGLTQTALAAQAGISGSYLNLIEHNKRAIGGNVLLAIARALEVPASELSEAADSGLLDTLNDAAELRGAKNRGMGNTAEFAGRFPEWARLLAVLFRQTQDQATALATLSDRLTHDPFLAENFHLMLSNITAIRSASEILTSVSEIEPAQRNRFIRAIEEESARLSEAASALVAYFDNPDGQDSASATPQETADRFFDEHDYHFPRLEAAEAQKSDVDALLGSAAEGPARGAISRMLTTYLTAARAMPADNFLGDARNCAYDPAILAQIYGTDLHAVFERLAILARTDATAPSLQLLIVNASGHALRRVTLPGFSPPLYGNACTLWPAFRAFSRPGQPLKNIIEMPDGTQFATLSIAQPRTASSFADPPEYRSAMLLIPLEQVATHMPWLKLSPEVALVGTSCRICPRQSCASRVEARL